MITLSDFAERYRMHMLEFMAFFAFNCEYGRREERNNVIINAFHPRDRKN